MCAIANCELHYGCRLKQKKVALSASAIPNRVWMRPPKMAEPSWEKGIMTETRPGGYTVPVLNSDLSGPVSIKEYGENRHRYDENRRREIQQGVSP